MVESNGRGELDNKETKSWEGKAIVSDEGGWGWWSQMI